MSMQDLKERRIVQKEANLLREISRLFIELTQDKPELYGLSVNRVKLSQDKSSCTVFFYMLEGEKKFQEIFPILILYKPSLRKALSQEIRSRYTPNLIFKYDVLVEKQQRVNDLLMHVIDENKKAKEQEGEEEFSS